MLITWKYPLFFLEEPACNLLLFAKFHCLRWMFRHYKRQHVTHYAMFCNIFGALKLNDPCLQYLLTTQFTAWINKMASLILILLIATAYPLLYPYTCSLLMSHFHLILVDFNSLFQP